MAALRAEPATLLLEEEPLRRTATQLVLHGRQGLLEGTITLVLTPVTLGGRPWARLQPRAEGPPAVWRGISSA